MVAVPGRATAEIMVIAIAMFVLQVLLGTIGLGIELFALATPLSHQPWTIVTSVYAHGNLDHLIANLIGLLIFGLLVERRSTRYRLHGFVLVTGVLAALAQVLVATLFGVNAYVVGISGAVFALMGYSMTSNPVTESVIGWFELNARTQIVIMIVIAVVITWVTRAEQAALFGHFTGFLLGMVAGRIHVLRAF